MKKNLIIVCCVLITGCAIGPNYKRPPLDIPNQYTGMDIEPVGPDDSLGDEPWWQVFQDKTLQDLIHQALAQSFDLRIAADNIIEAQQQLNIANSYELPNLTLNATPQDERVEKIRSSSPFSWGSYQLTGTASWDIDFWGQYRRQIESNRDALLGSQWAQKQVIITLITDVASAYFQLRELDMELEISKSTLFSRQQSLELTKRLAQHGSASLLDVAQAEQLVYTASTNIADTERRRGQQENLLNVLLGNNPGYIKRGISLDDEPLPPHVPAGLPSLLIERRPDILQAEAALKQSNAEIGVAEGYYLPAISLTGTGGYQSAALSQLFNGPSGLFNIAANFSQPIFNGGRIRAGVKNAQAMKDAALNQYRKTIQEAFREVSDALIAYRKTQEFTTQQQLLTNAAKEALRLSNLRYKGGVASYLEVLTSDTTYYSAKLQLAQARLNQLQSLVDLYKALGGGWHT